METGHLGEQTPSLSSRRRKKGVNGVLNASHEQTRSSGSSLKTMSGYFDLLCGCFPRLRSLQAIAVTHGRQHSADLMRLDKAMSHPGTSCWCLHACHAELYGGRGYSWQTARPFITKALIAAAACSGHGTTRDAARSCRSLSWISWRHSRPKKTSLCFSPRISARSASTSCSKASGTGPSPRSSRASRKPNQCCFGRAAAKKRQFPLRRSKKHVNYVSV